MGRVSRIKDYISYVESLSEEDFVKHLIWIGVISEDDITKIKEDEGEDEDEEFSSWA